jgi:eukaryotic-like serine/threonine-protein kinase
MTAERWSFIGSLFAQAVELSPGELQPFLDRVCGRDEELRRELESLLACDAPGERLIDISSDLPSALEDDAASQQDMTGGRIGPYRLVRRIGQGGMGAVYLGIRDDDQYQKQVAIKVLKRGMDTDFMLNRFRQERQILANLDHPFIARMFDGGATGDGLPYFVMEYVDGVPITKYCGEKGLTVIERLRVFRLVCEAVQYAHRNLVVHRDIKPSNILTTKEGTPKLLDFGISKVLDPGVPMDTAVTQRELRMLTPDYASPEQLKGLRISTASDIYSLGAVLFELLTGELPHRTESGSLAELEKAICETDAQAPSSVVARNGALAKNVRHELKRHLAGDLDNIVLMAMRKEPEGRYSSAAELSEDLRRYMEGLPVLAQVDRWTYRARKFVRRNRLMVGAALLVAASLVTGIVTTTVQASRAERRFQLVRGLANTMLFDLHDQMEHLPGSTALRAATIHSVTKYLDTLASDGSHDSNLDLEIALAYERAGNIVGHPYMSNLGRTADAINHYRKALTIYERLSNLPSVGDKATRGLIETHLKSAQLHSLLGDPDRAASHFRRVSEMANEALVNGSHRIPPYTWVHVYFRLADAEYHRGDATAEVAQYRKALEVSRKLVSERRGANAMGVLRDSLKNVGSAQARGGDLYGALESFRSSGKIAEELSEMVDAKPELHYNTISTHLSLGDLFGAPDDPNLGDRAAARSHYERAFVVTQDLAKNDKNNVNARRNMATCYWRLCMISFVDKPREAVEFGRKAVQISEELRTGDPLNAEYRYHASRAYLWIGEALRRLHRPAEAVDSLRRALEIQETIAVVSPERIWNLRALSRTYLYLGVALLDAGDPDGALDALREALEVAERMLQRAPSSLPHQLDRADVLEAMGRHYLTLASRSRIRAAELKRTARSCFHQSLAIWQDWTRRGLAVPYSARREAQVARALASTQ